MSTGEGSGQREESRPAAGNSGTFSVLRIDWPQGRALVSDGQAQMWIDLTRLAAAMRAQSDLICSEASAEDDFTFIEQVSDFGFDRTEADGQQGRVGK
ncbi:hypothetical protein GCM10010985_61200 [Caballeronia grimmiae]|nr:hypothetical protein GCM10010985_61200 [Caballeronia grimmiae]